MALWQAVSPACPACRQNENQMKVSYVLVKGANKSVYQAAHPSVLFVGFIFIVKAGLDLARAHRLPTVGQNPSMFLSL